MKINVSKEWLISRAHLEEGHEIGALNPHFPHHPPHGTEARVCQDIADRQQKGIAKYGTTVEANPLTLREWLQHAYEECLDQAVYLRRAIEEMDAIDTTPQATEAALLPLVGHSNVGTVRLMVGVKNRVCQLTYYVPGTPSPVMRKHTGKLREVLAAAAKDLPNVSAGQSLGDSPIEACEEP